MDFPQSGFRFLILFGVMILVPWGSLKAQTNQVVKAPVATPEQQTSNAVQPVNSPSFNLSSGASDAMVGSLSSGPHHTKGLQFKDPTITPGFSYTASDDTSLGGFVGNTFSGDLGMDADIYDGLIAGAIYQHTSRGASNSVGTKESLDSDGFSVYAGKRLFDCLNLGAAYNHLESRHRLTGSVSSNLDSSTDGYTLLAGVSNKHGKWNWAMTTSFGYSNEDYDQQQTMQTGRFGWGGSLTYDATKQFTLGAAFTYYNFVFQDSFNGVAPRDDDYYDIGPRFSYYLNDRTVVKMDFDSQQGYTDLANYTLRVSCDVSF